MRRRDRAKRIQFYVTRAGLTQKALATLLDVSEQAVWQWFHGQTSPTLENLARICRVCGITLEQFFGPLPPRPAEAVAV